MPPPLRAAGELGISYRPLTEGDMRFVAALYASTRREEIAQTGWPAETQAAFLHQQHIAQHAHYQASYKDAEWLIVERAGEAIGRLYLHRTQHALSVVDISLAPSARGGGIGSAILADVLAQAREEGLPVDLQVEINNPARRLYERLGFVVRENMGIYDAMRAEP